MKHLAFIFRVSDWPFALKMGICPALAMLALMGLGIHGVLQAGEQAKLMRAVVDQDLTWASGLAASADHLQEINGQLYRLSTLQAAHDGDLAVDREVRGLTQKSDALAEELGSFARMSVSPKDRAELELLVSDIRLYRDAIDVVGSMLAIDFPSAVELIKPFDGNARRVLASLDSMTRRAGEDAELRARASAALADRSRIIVGMAAFAVSLVLIGMTALLVRATVRSVGLIALATTRVAKGDQSLDIGALQRADELGTIVESLGAFQANVAQIAFLAHHDPLTRLPNRILFRDRVLQALKLLDRGNRFALFFLDLDHFKEVNDTLGHPVGDGLLQQVALRLGACVRDGDTVARLGGDEFAILLPGIESTDAAAHLADRIIEAIREPYEVAGNAVNIGTSIGIAFAPNDGAYPDMLLRNADMALYRAKMNERGTSCFFEAAMDVELQARRTLELDMRRAIIEREFELYYQPLVNVKTGSVSGFEALIRWQHPMKGTISPVVFVPIAEETGLIVPLGQWILRQACLDAVAWPVNLKVAVNLSSSTVPRPEPGRYRA